MHALPCTTNNTSYQSKLRYISWFLQVSAYIAISGTTLNIACGLWSLLAQNILKFLDLQVNVNLRTLDKCKTWGPVCDIWSSLPEDGCTDNHMEAKNVQLSFTTWALCWLHYQLKISEWRRVGSLHKNMVCSFIQSWGARYLVTRL
jgi:hypothetical protein